MKKRAFILGLSGAIIAGGVYAYEVDGKAPANAMAESELVSIAQAEIEGEILEIEYQTEDGIEVAEIEIQTDAGEIEVELNALTGEVLEIEDDGKHDKDDD